MTTPSPHLPAPDAAPVLHGRVLVVDDSTTSRRKMVLAVKALGLDWIEADSGEAALDLLAREKVDLILLDILMPGLDGFGVLDALRADKRLADLPVLVISGMDGDMDSVARAIELGAADFLPKDFNAIILRARVWACIEKKRLRDAELDHLAQVERIAAAAAVIEERAFHPKNLGLGSVAARSDSIGRLARVFEEMAQQVYDRERALRRSVRTATGVVLLLLSGIVGGLMAPMSAMIFDRIPMAIGLSFWADLLPGILCMAGAMLFGGIGGISRQTLAVLTVWAVLNAAAGIILFEAAGQVSGIVLSIILSLEGLGVFVIAAVLRMEEASWRRFLGLMIGLSGVAVLIAVRETSVGANPWFWVVVTISIPVMWAITDVLIASRNAMGTVKPLAALGVMYLLSAVLTLPFALAKGQFFLLSPDLGPSFWLILVNAVIDTANYVLYVLLIAVAGAVFGSQAAYVTTLAGIFWSILLLDEALTGGTTLALVLIFAGLFVVGPKSEAADIEVQFVPKSRRKGLGGLFRLS